MKIVSLLDEKVKAIKNAPEPTNLKELQQYLGLLNYYNKFIPNLASELKVLYKLLCKNNNFIWDKRCKKAFEDSKLLLINNKNLVLYDPNKPIIVCVDAGQKGLGCVLALVDFLLLVFKFSTFYFALMKPLTTVGETLSTSVSTLTRSNPERRSFSSIDFGRRSLCSYILKEFFIYFGLLDTIVSDNGPPFDSIKFQIFYENNKITFFKSPPYHSQSNGLAERGVETVKNYIKKFLLDKELRKLSISDKVRKLIKVYNFPPSTTTLFFPLDLVFRFKYKTLQNSITNEIVPGKIKVRFGLSNLKVKDEIVNNKLEFKPREKVPRCV